MQYWIHDKNISKFLHTFFSAKTCKSTNMSMHKIGTFLFLISVHNMQNSHHRDVTINNFFLWRPTSISSIPSTIIFNTPKGHIWICDLHSSPTHIFIIIASSAAKKDSCTATTIASKVYTKLVISKSFMSNPVHSCYKIQSR